MEYWSDKELLTTLEGSVIVLASRARARSNTIHEYRAKMTGSDLFCFTFAPLRLCAR